MNDTEKLEREVRQGRVKWFDPAKGFGFIVVGDGQPDILLHANVLRNFGQSSVSEGSEITVEVMRSERGLQAAEVLVITPPATPAHAPLADLEGIDPASIAGLPIEPARVKWFDIGKGFGFANIFGAAEDVFIHIEVMRRSGLADLQPGEAICLRTIQGRRGKMAVEVFPWEAGLKKP